MSKEGFGLSAAFERASVCHLAACAAVAVPAVTVCGAPCWAWPWSLTMIAMGVFLMVSWLLGRLGPTEHCSVLAVSTRNLLAPGVASAIGTATSWGWHESSSSSSSGTKPC
jgi:hypothetical protein